MSAVIMTLEHLELGFEVLQQSGDDDLWFACWGEIKRNKKNPVHQSLLFFHMDNASLAGQCIDIYIFVLNVVVPLLYLSLSSLSDKVKCNSSLGQFIDPQN